LVVEVVIVVVVENTVVAETVDEVDDVVTR
jgi:hypothetical protein